MSAPLAFVGDLHGSARPLAEVLRRFGGRRHVVFLGDYVNRGPDTRRVLQLLLAASRLWPGDITLLRGNHDQALIDFLRDGDVTKFARMGGLATISSYVAEAGDDVLSDFRTAIPASHISLLEGLHDYFEREDIFASHCGPDPQRPESRERGAVALGSHSELFRLEHPGPLGKQVVCGHYIQRGGKPHLNDWLAAVDAGLGSVPGARLAVFLWPERDIETFGGCE